MRLYREATRAVSRGSRSHRSSGVTDWSQLAPVVLDGHYDALSFFSEGGFRYFLPAYVIADLKDQLHTADPVFHLTNGFIDKVVKIPRWETDP